MTRPSDISEQVYERAAILMDELRHIEDDLEYTARVIMAVEAEQAKKRHAGLTPVQSKVLNFVDGFEAKHGHSPSYIEIMNACGLASKSGVHRLVHGLVARGALEAMPGRARSLVVVGR
jgi:hypothetical protein